MWQKQAHDCAYQTGTTLLLGFLLALDRRACARAPAAARGEAFFFFSAEATAAAAAVGVGCTGSRMMILARCGAAGVEGMV